MVDPVSLAISTLSLAVSAVTAWLTLFRRGTVKMTQPTVIFFGPDTPRPRVQQSGIGELVGLVLHENKPMLDMCRELGFSIAPEPNDAAVLRVRKSLAPV
jgi:hypothetical protein